MFLWPTLQTHAPGRHVLVLQVVLQELRLLSTTEATETKKRSQKYDAPRVLFLHRICLFCSLFFPLDRGRVMKLSKIPSGSDLLSAGASSTVQVDVVFGNTYQWQESTQLFSHSEARLVWRYKLKTSSAGKATLWRRWLVRLR